MKKILFSLAVFVFSVTVVKAASFGGLGIYPANPNPDIPLSGSWLIYNLVPGEEKTDTVIVQNTSEETMSAKIYAVDATTTRDGAFALLNDSDPRKDIGSWVEIPVKEITLAPGENRQINFTMKVPSGAKTGSHLGGIVLENMEVSEGKGVDVVTRVGVRIYQTVPGVLVRLLELTELTWKMVDDKVNLMFKLENKGNVHLDVTGKIEFINSFTGKTKATEEADLRTVIPDKPTEVPFVWKKAPLAGSYVARITIDYGNEAEIIEREIKFMYVTRKALILGGIGLVVLLVVRAVAASKRKRR